MILPILYLVINNIKINKTDLKRSIIIIFLMVIGAATHPYPILCFALLVLAFSFTMRTSSKSVIAGHLGLLFMISSTISLAWWNFVSDDVLRIGYFLKSIIFYDEGLDSSSIYLYQYVAWDELLSSLGFLIPIILTTAGFYMINKNKYSHNQKMFSWIFLALTGLMLLTLMLDILFLGTRWLYFSMLICSIVIAVFFVNGFVKDYRRYKVAIACIIVFLMAFTAINSTICNEDNRDLYVSARDSNFLTDSQIVGSYFVRDCIEVEMISGIYYASVVSYLGVNSTAVSNINYEELEGGGIIMILPHSTTELNSIEGSDYNVIYSSNNLFGAFLYN
ncbi:MAG: hypothetical protein ACOWWR_13930 [Eubacteriales bacterium]